MPDSRSLLPQPEPPQLELDIAKACTTDRPGSILGHGQIAEIIGADGERIDYDKAHATEIDAILTASCEFRHTVIVPYGCMSRGEAQHILRGLKARRRDVQQ